MSFYSQFKSRGKAHLTMSLNQGNEMSGWLDWTLHSGNACEEEMRAKCSHVLRFLKEAGSAAF